MLRIIEFLIINHYSLNDIWWFFSVYDSVTESELIIHSAYNTTKLLKFCFIIYYKFYIVSIYAIYFYILFLTIPLRIFGRKLRFVDRKIDHGRFYNATDNKCTVNVQQRGWKTQGKEAYRDDMDRLKRTIPKRDNRTMIDRKTKTFRFRDLYLLHIFRVT